MSKLFGSKTDWREISDRTYGVVDSLPRQSVGGSGRQHLIGPLCDAMIALGNALAAVRSTAPHPRDYRGRDDAYTMAHREHLDRIVQLTLMQGALTTRAEAIDKEWRE